MDYLGRLVTNVRGFYSEINSATLTGAIDVVVIRQEDGSFVGSPFHVRFGKLGVLRSREKIVDIEVNGNPVPLHMKLGDAGEAFFVEEVEEPMDSRNEMATSPIPSVDHMGETIDEEEEQIEDNKIKDEGSESKETDPSNTEALQNNSNLDTELIETQSIDDNETNKDKERDSISNNENTPIESTETEINTGNETVQNSETVEETGTDNKEELATQDDNHREPAKDEEKGEGKVKGLAGSGKSDETMKEVATAEIKDALEIPADIPDSGKMETNEDDSGGSYPLSDSIPIPGREREIFSDSDSSNWMMDSTSPIEEHHFIRRDHLYPLSDLDSPIGSPPDSNAMHIRAGSTNPLHCLSDTEVEIKQSQENMSKRNDEVTWDWGKLPKAPENMYPHDRKINDLKREEAGYILRAKRRDYLRSHKIKEEGIYLDDLTSVDDEIARLYLNQALSKSREHKNTPSAEDRESGIGQSLPSSPSAEESGHKESSTDTYQDLAMSLCGELRNSKVPLESFMKHMVTFEDLSNDPTLLSNPKLVIRINDRYFNWQIAAPMLMSYLIFQRPLQQETVQMLMKQHMPKKEKRRSYWFWRQNYEDQSSDEEEELKKDKHRSRTHSSSRKHLTTTPTGSQYLEGEGRDGEQYDPSQYEDHDPLLAGPHRQRNVSECTSGNESDMVNYRKTTRLSSEQLANLSLRNGANSIEFSVTTKYQGTAACQATIYLWNFDDRIVISDIDGTITKSDVLGHILPVVGSSWAQSGVAHFFSAIQNNGYKLVYLSARAIGQAQLTRDYLKSVKQDQICLPDGPLLLSPASLIKAFHREVIEKKPEEFKISALRDILSLFPKNKNPFYGGFGNKINDVYSYRAVGVSVSRIFTINHKGEVTNELATTFQSSYIHLSDLVDQMFPPYKKQQDSAMRPSGLVAPDEFSSFTYWRNPLPDIDLNGFDETTEAESPKPTEQQ